MRLLCRGREGGREGVGWVKDEVRKESEGKRVGRKGERDRVKKGREMVEKGRRWGKFYTM